MLFSSKKTIKLPALTQLKKAFYYSSVAHEKNIKDVQSFAEEQESNTLSRRRFVSDMAKTGVIASTVGLYQACNSFNKKTQPSIAIIGAGIAGLHAAYMLQQAGYKADVYEASGRVGGRIFSVPGVMGEGLWTEMGGEFIDTDHTDMMNLVKHFNLPAIDRKSPSELALKEYSYYFNKTHYELKDVMNALGPVIPQLKKDIASVSPDLSYIKHSAADIEMDNMTIMQYIEKLGITGWLKSFIYNGYTAEYGMEADEQSALNFLGLISFDDNGFRPYGNSDERFSVAGGNEKICRALAESLKTDIHKGYTLTAVKQNNINRYVLTFNKDGNRPEDITADIIILTLPFSVLQDVDIKIPLPGWKQKAIKELGYGTNSKIFAGVKERVWRKQGYAGYTFTDNGLMNGYDSTQMQNNNQGAGVFTIAPGGKQGMQVGTGDVKLMQQNALEQLDEIYPGTKQQFNGKLQYWNWPNYPFAKCSYMSLKAGQYTTLSGTQFQPVDNMYFAGEHCSIASQGFMNGGAETGRMAAELIIKKLKTK